MTESLGHKAASGAVWASIDRFGFMTLQFVVNLILARLLIPADFGIIGMLAIFIAVSQTLIDSGFGSALIQKKNPTQTDFSTIFYWNIAFSLVLYVVLFIASPFVAKYFHMELLSSVLRVIGINLIISGIFSIQSTRLRKQFAFKTIAITNLSAYSFGAALGITLAYFDWGVWSLIAMQITSGIIGILVVAFITRWYPSMVFSINSLRELFGFGGYILSANILQTICQNVQGLIIGRKFSAGQMGYYSQAYKLDQVASQSIPQVIVQVMYPVYSSIQDDRQRLIEMVGMNQRVIAFLMFPIIGLLILIASPLIHFLYGEQWLPSAPYFQILCVGGFFVCLQNINFYAVAAIGKSRTLFFWSFFKWGFLLTALLVGANFGMNGILWGMVLSNINIYAVNATLVSKHVGLSLMKQLIFILPITAITFVAMAITYVSYSIVHSIFWQISLFLLLYVIFSLLFKLKAIKETRMVVTRLINRNK